MNQRRRIVLSLSIAALAIIPPAVALAAPPANDNFANAEQLGPDFADFVATNAEATEERDEVAGTGEPQHAGMDPFHSVWYRWSPAADGSNTLDTCGSSFDTRLAVYVGSDVGSLSQIAANDNSTGPNCASTQASEVTSTFSAGATYYIAVDTSGPAGSCGPVGPFQLRLNASGSASPLSCSAPSSRPQNDDFSAAGLAAFPVDGGSYSGTNTGATAESSEPNHAGTAAVHSIWYSWTPSAASQATVSTCGATDFNSRLAVYTGSALDALTKVAENEDSAGPTCAGSKFAEATFTAGAGQTYWIAVDTSGDLAGDGSGPSQGSVAVKLTTAPPPPSTEDTTNPGTAKPVRTIRNFRIPRFIASCGDDTPKGDEQCTQGPFQFNTPKDVQTFLRKLEAKKIPSRLKSAGSLSSKGVKIPAQAKALRESGETGEITFAAIELEYVGGDDTPLEQGKRYTIRTDETVTVRYSYFDLSKDKTVIAEEKAALKKAAEKLAQQQNKPPKSRCLPIAAGESQAQIKDRLQYGRGYISHSDAISTLSKLGCDVSIERFVKGRPSAPHAYVKDVIRTNAKTDTVFVELAQPGSHDFIFAIREDPSQFLANQNKNNIPIGTDGQLTVSDTQASRFTVQVIERASGRFVPGIPVEFNGQTETTKANGETSFASVLREERDYRLSAVYGDMEGWRTIHAEKRKGAFISMAGRKFIRPKKTYGASDSSQLQFAASLPVVPANLGSGDVGGVDSIPRVEQATVTTFDSSGREFTGQHNVVSVPNNSSVLVGAGPGLLALGGGDAAQTGRRLARAGTDNPLGFLGSILGSLKKAIDTGVSNVNIALTALNQASIARSANLIGQAGGNLISDKGLGVISTGGGNVIGTGGLNLISDKGLGVISTGGGNLIGQAGGNLIGQAGGNVISTGGGNAVPVFGGNVISTGGGN